MAEAGDSRRTARLRRAWLQLTLQLAQARAKTRVGFDLRRGDGGTHTRSAVSELVGYATMDGRRRSVDDAIARLGDEDGRVRVWLRLGCVGRLATRDDGAAFRVAGRRPTMRK
ncbi:hypothetical protein E5676_scaffold2510G00240 [Cucumis melo var. makuwa]|uniref:Uncharacterized protein n=1 Tax=Cucumis melo var. makuwa TaxID=1194695 RepID=A0A5A7UB87_CUCMM|nr:hypothetical protein E6C27_scaffold1192G00300 [Cucumis melo var. makuwa]TYK00138.1 hypothetical protein E5676_scaffold2510G00240 [Cucumis melo var. makuwa]